MAQALRRAQVGASPQGLCIAGAREAQQLACEGAADACALPAWLRRSQHFEVVCHRSARLRLGRGALHRRERLHGAREAASSFVWNEVEEVAPDGSSLPAVGAARLGVLGAPDRLRVGGGFLRRRPGLGERGGAAELASARGLRVDEVHVFLAGRAQHCDRAAGASAAGALGVLLVLLARVFVPAVREVWAWFAACVKTALPLPLSLALLFCAFGRRAASLRRSRAGGAALARAEPGRDSASGAPFANWPWRAVLARARQRLVEATTRAALPLAPARRGRARAQDAVVRRGRRWPGVLGGDDRDATEVLRGVVAEFVFCVVERAELRAGGFERFLAVRSPKRGVELGLAGFLGGQVVAQLPVPVAGRVLLELVAKLPLCRFTFVDLAQLQLLDVLVGALRRSAAALEGAIQRHIHDAVRLRLAAFLVHSLRELGAVEVGLFGRPRALGVIDEALHLALHGPDVLRDRRAGHPDDPVREARAEAPLHVVDRGIRGRVLVVRDSPRAEKLVVLRVASGLEAAGVNCQILIVVVSRRLRKKFPVAVLIHGRDELGHRLTLRAPVQELAQAGPHVLRGLVLRGDNEQVLNLGQGSVDLEAHGVLMEPGGRPRGARQLLQWRAGEQLRRGRRLERVPTGSHRDARRADPGVVKEDSVRRAAAGRRLQPGTRVPRWVSAGKARSQRVGGVAVAHVLLVAGGASAQLSLLGSRVRGPRCRVLVAVLVAAALVHGVVLAPIAFTSFTSAVAARVPGLVPDAPWLVSLVGLQDRLGIIHRVREQRDQLMSKPEGPVGPSKGRDRRFAGGERGC